MVGSDAVTPSIAASNGEITPPGGFLGNNRARGPGNGEAESRHNPNRRNGTKDASAEDGGNGGLQGKFSFQNQCQNYNIVVSDKWNISKLNASAVN